jgi:4-amino-4-deoxy-L-arabinose transferase-like glycosyltransferase
MDEIVLHKSRWSPCTMRLRSAACADRSSIGRLDEPDGPAIDAMTTAPVDGSGRAGLRNFRIFACVLLVALTVPRMWQRGMFLDGLIYASVSRNLAAGDGTIWAPTHTATDDAPFFEHPPLGFALESIGFRIAGDSFFVERIYSLLVFGLHALTIMAIWRRLLPARYDWLPLVFWIVPAVVTWSVVNNMLENTQALFTTAAVYCLIRTVQDASAVMQSTWSILAGVAVVAATLTKGPVGLFPLGLLLFFPLLPRAQRPHDARLAWTLMVLVIAAAAVALMALEGPRHDIAEYLRRQVVPSLRGQREVTSAQLGIVRFLGLEIIGRIAVVVAALWSFRARSGSGAARVDPAAWFFLAIGLAASLPIAMSPKMSGHYFVPSVAFLALAAAAMCLPAVTRLDALKTGGWGERSPLILAALLLVATIAVPVLHGPVEPRDLETVASLEAIANAVPRGSIVGTCRASQYDWSMASYMERFFKVALDARDAPVDGWFFVSDRACPPPAECRPAAAGTTLALYRCDSASPR